MLGKYHFIGIGGIGMSGLARLLLNKNASVSGSDLSATAVTNALVKSGAKVYIGHASEHVESDMTIIYSTDIKKENTEYQAAIKLQCPIH
jgi:UDP-N-acetylmuramate--alanine ligase